MKDAHKIRLIRKVLNGGLAERLNRAESAATLNDKETEDAWARIYQTADDVMAGKAGAEKNYRKALKAFRELGIGKLKYDPRGHSIQGNMKKYMP